MASKVRSTAATVPVSNDSQTANWRMVRFDELAHMVNERVDPSDTDADIYVGLEHLDSGTLKISRWGTPSDVIGDKLRFRKGDIIFGRRRAYQRKLAVTEFDGICSAHAMVVRAKVETVDPAFLPFLMQSDLFMQRAIDISVGSLSPTINWKTLRIQKFPLPPKDEQHRIADILWAADNMCLRYCDVLSALERTRLSLSAQFYDSETAASAGVRMVRVIDIGASERQPVQVGPFGGSVCSRHFQPSGVPVIKVNNINDEGEVSLCDPVFVSNTHAHSLERYRVVAGDVLIAAQRDTTGKSGLAGDDVAGGIISQHLIRVALDRSLCRPRFVAAIFCSEPIQRQIKAVKIKTTRPGLNTEDVENFLIPLPTLDVQDEVCGQLERIEHAKQSCRMAIANAIHLRSLLVNGLTANVH